MRIVCVDASAADRVALQRHFDTVYEACREYLGHLNLADTVPASKEELLVSSAPELIAVGSAYSIELSFSTCRDLREAFPQTPIIVFLKAEAYSLRTMRRLERVSNEIFSVDEDPIRVAHKLISISRETAGKPSGRLITVSGVKGGVGATSVVSGIAHAAEALGKSSVVIDLSESASFSHYMAASRWQSSDFAAAIVDGISPDRSLIEKCITTAPNGINLFLPPSGGTDVRELWLRSSDRFEITLSAVEILQEMFDLVIVDMAGAEGVLHFALQCRAQGKLLVTSNDPASVHLLTTKLSKLVEIPGDGTVSVLINTLVEKGLTREDVLDFLYYNEQFSDEMATLAPIPFDERARNWIGTGNSFYTESPIEIQRLLESTARELLGEIDYSEREQQDSVLVLLRKKLKSLSGASAIRKKISPPPRLLPMPTKAVAKTGPHFGVPEDESLRSAIRVNASIPTMTQGNSGDPIASNGFSLLAGQMYEPPKLTNNKKGEQ
jgi:MinD-like ATPase involved in chromosome partitioning or flagellar assembly